MCAQPECAQHESSAPCTHESEDDTRKPQDSYDFFALHTEPAEPDATTDLSPLICHDAPQCLVAEAWPAQPVTTVAHVSADGCAGACVAARPACAWMAVTPAPTADGYVCHFFADNEDAMRAPLTDCTGASAISGGEIAEIAEYAVWTDGPTAVEINAADEANHHSADIGCDECVCIDFADDANHGATPSEPRNTRANCRAGRLSPWRACLGRCNVQRGPRSVRRVLRAVWLPRRYATVVAPPPPLLSAAGTCWPGPPTAIS